MPTMEIVRVRVPFRAPFSNAARTWTARDSWLVRVTGDDGSVGWGEALLDDPADETAAGAFEALLDRMGSSGDVPTTQSLEEEGPAGRALLAALAGAATKQGADARPDARGIGVNALVAAVDRGRAAEEAAGRVAAGFRTLKLKVRPDETAEALVARVEEVRDAVGDAVNLRLDANGTWDLATASEILGALDDRDLGIQYVEQPLAVANLEGLITLRRRVGIPVAADEAVASVEAAHLLLDHDAVDVLVVKPARVGGMMAVARIESMATPRGIPVVVASLFETGVGLASALACASWVAQFSDLPGWPADERDHGLATADLLEDDLLLAPLVIEAGRMRAPGGEGATALGIAVDLEAVERYRVRA
jgi:L-Ala-D/L-Glu epimerase